MKKMFFLTLTLLSLINVEAFASQPQPARTPSWWSWAPYAAGAVALAGTGLSIHYYKKFAGDYESENNGYESQKYDAKIAEQAGDVAKYTREASTLENIRDDAEQMKKPLFRNASVASLETQINLLQNISHKSIFQGYPYALTSHIEKCIGLCPQGIECGTINGFANNITDIVKDKLKQNGEAKALANERLTNLQAKQKERYDAVQSLKTKKNVALGTSIAFGGSFIGLAGFSIYNWWKGR